MKYLGELIQSKNDSENFDFLASNIKNCYSVENVGDEDVANEISRGLLLAGPDIKYSTKVGFPQKFIELSRSADTTGSICKLTILLSLAVGLVVGVVAMIMSSNFFVGISALTSAVLMGLPMATSLVSAINLRATNKLLNQEGALLNGYSAVEEAVNSNGVIIDSCDAFEEGGCNLEGMKTYHKMRIDEAILYTASVVIASGGVLAEVFDGVIIGKRELLLPVESLAYEEKLGCSCWIHNHRVLVGNRDLLVHHNVETPDKDLEDKYKSNGRNVLYLAIEGKIAAMFVVVYKANEETARYMRELEKDGITIFFRTADASITEKFLEREFQLPANVVKIINPVAGDMFS
jgi:Cu+-exporting ATPase